MHAYAQPEFSSDLIDSAYFTNDDFQFDLDELHLGIVWYSMKLSALNEPILRTKTTEETIYRFLYVNAFRGAYSIRVVKKDSSMMLIHSGTDQVTKRVISANEWKKLHRKIQRSGFWQMAPVESTNGKDGSQWILEGYEKGNYHVTDRWLPKRTSRYRRVCTYFRKLSGM